MSNCYDYDLRPKVMDAIELDGMPKTEASRVFNVSRNTIHLWVVLYFAWWRIKGFTIEERLIAL